MKTAFHKIFYTSGGCIFGFAASSLPVYISELSDWSHDWLNSKSGEVIMTAIFFVFVITGGVIGYRRCARAIRDGKMNFRRSLLLLCVSIVLAVAIIWTGNWYIGTHLPDCGDCTLPAQKVAKLNTPESVCQYIQQDKELRNFKKPVKFGFKQCENYECSAKEATAEDAILPSWEVRYRCPGPASFRLGQIYFMEVNKITGSIEVGSASN